MHPGRELRLPNEDCPRFLEKEEYRHREYGSVLFRRELTFIKASQRVAEGEIRSSWRRNCSDSITFEFSVPKGCRAEVHLSRGTASVSDIYEAGEYTVTL